MAILVVDDSRAMRMIVRRELRKAGYEDVVEAENGRFALDTIRAGGVDLVLSDWNMPDMNGIELLAELRKGGHDLPFGFVTSESAPDVRVRAFEVGASFIITKPFTSEDLDREIDLALGGEAVIGGAGGSNERTIDTVLAGLLGRDVTLTPSPEPERQTPRMVAEYSSSGSRLLAVFEMSLAAGLACALARIPSGEAVEWAQARGFNEAVEANFFEVANVLGAFASKNSDRCVLQAIQSLDVGQVLEEMRGSPQWHRTVQIDIDGYPSGRLGFVSA